MSEQSVVQLNAAQIAAIKRDVADRTNLLVLQMNLRKWAMELVLNTQAEIKQQPDVKKCLELATAVYEFVAPDAKP